MPPSTLTENARHWTQLPPRFTFHYLVESGIYFLTLTDKGYPKKLAFQVNPSFPATLSGSPCPFSCTMHHCILTSLPVTSNLANQACFLFTSALQYLEELCGEFGRLYGSQVDTASRPYAFIKFGALLTRSCLLGAWVRGTP